MPPSPPSSTGSSPPSASRSAADPLPLPRWRLPLLLFGLTVASVLYTGARYVEEPGAPFRLRDGLPFAATLLAILVSHELAHFFFARRHRVNASLPFFLPLPGVSEFGTMGAIIVMRDRIRSRDALLDIGASGPIAGMLVAIPALLYGLARSPVKPLDPHGAMEGQSLLYSLLKRLALGPIPAGHDVFLGPVAFAGWVGLFVTMLNLLPIGQLDGGHVAYALLGPRQHVHARRVRWLLLALVPLNFAWYAWPVRHAEFSLDAYGPAISAAMPWLGWSFAITVLGRVSGMDHPPTEPGALSPTRRAVAIGTLALFALIFMPTPWLVR